jgi:hypothetical protein
MLAQGPFIVAVNNDFPVKTPAELVAAPVLDQHGEGIKAEADRPDRRKTAGGANNR